MNVCVFLGRLTRDPELKHVGNTSLTEFGIAVSRKFKTTQGETKEEVNFLDMVAWDRGAETISEYFKKGDQILVHASAKQDSWKDKDTGANRSKIVFRVDRFFFTSGSSKRNNDEGEAEPVGAGVSAPVSNVDGVPAQDEIPF